MRRTIPVLLTATLLLAACGSSDGDSSEDTTDTTDAAETETAGTDDEGTEPAVTFEDVGPPPTNPDKPTVDLPAETPDELEITVLSPGEGEPAETGDTVIVDYIGVRSSDGVEFDNSYDRFEPFPVVLGTGSVIQGWDDGLIDAQTGARIQLDIPSGLAYGEAARGDIIGENEALTFIIDVRAVIPPADLADEPTQAGVPESNGATEVTSVDLIDGDGAELEEGQTAVFRLVLFRADNLVALDSTWAGDAIQLPMTDGSFPGLVEGMPGMKVGGRRAVIIPPDKGFLADGDPTIGLPADTDIVIVVDLIGVY
jgi:FKBP-type peptidyl-prolyl cis-trans isomerase